MTKERMQTPLTGLIAATYTPLQADGSVNADAIAPITERLLASGVTGLYVCGSTGEGMSLTTAERMTVAEAYVKATAGRVPVVIQVGHNSIQDACDLAAHAADVGADVVSATTPSYYKVGSVDLLVDCMAKIAGSAPALPFYFYHIPALTGVPIDVSEFLRRGADAMDNLAGCKYTEPTVHEFASCQALDNGRFDMLWGTDEMLLSAWVAGARGAVGSTYNVAAPVYLRMIEALDRGDLDAARAAQSQAVQMIDVMKQFPFHSAMKVLLARIGMPCGNCRLPQRALTAAESAKLLSDLDAIGYFDWSGMG
jgi:N-acetylneuraminate lyase